MITIAIVEDEEAYAKQLTEYIEQYQQESGKRFRVIRFTDGDEIVEKYTGEYDIILMDIQMPNMNGYQAAEAIRALPGKRGEIPIVAMTANAFSDDAARSRKAGMNEHLTKPLDLEKITNAHIAKPVDVSVLLETLSRFS